MSYERQTWDTGDVITAEKLNHIEDGIGNAFNCGGLKVNTIYDNEAEIITLDKTMGENYCCFSFCIYMRFCYY